MVKTVKIIKGRFKGKIGKLIMEDENWGGLIKINGHFKNEIFCNEEYQVFSRSAAKRILKPKKDTTPKLWINIYRVTRKYGGPEEGGWYYNYYECIKSISFPIWKFYKANKKFESLDKIYKEREYGNIYSVLGGVEYSVLLEKREANSETKYIPTYC